MRRSGYSCIITAYFISTVSRMHFILSQLSPPASCISLKAGSEMSSDPIVSALVRIGTVSVIEESDSLHSSDVPSLGSRRG